MARATGTHFLPCIFRHEFRVVHRSALTTMMSAEDLSLHLMSVCPSTHRPRRACSLRRKQKAIPPPPTHTIHPQPQPLQEPDRLYPLLRGSHLANNYYVSETESYCNNFDSWSFKFYTQTVLSYLHTHCVYNSRVLHIKNQLKILNINAFDSKPRGVRGFAFSNLQASSNYILSGQKHLN